MSYRKLLLPVAFFAATAWPMIEAAAQETTLVETDEVVRLATPELEAAFNKQGYVTGVMRQSLLDKKTGFRDAGFGLDIVDWIMEPGSDAPYRDRLEPEMRYDVGNLYHGQRPKRSIEGPQICTQARTMRPVAVRGADFVAVSQQFTYRTAAPGKKTGSTWQQTIVFPRGKRYFVSSDKITSVNASEEMFLRIDMPGHIRHQRGDTFSEIYLSYQGRIAASEFFADFAPDEKFNYRRGESPMPRRFIRAYHLHDPKTGADGPWLAGMTLDPAAVSEAWCHQRGYVCLIEEFGGRPIQPGESFSAAFIVGYFDSIEEMERVYDEHAGYNGVEVVEQEWRLVGKEPPAASGR